MKITLADLALAATLPVIILLMALAFNGWALS